MELLKYKIGNRDKEYIQNLLLRKIEFFNDRNCMELMVQSKSNKIMGSNAFQDLVIDIYYGKLNVDISYLKVITLI